MAETRLMTLQPDGKLLKGARPSMDEEFLLDALRWMLLSRLYDEKVIGLQRQGRFGVYSPGLGQEASIVGSSMALDPERDWIVPQYRELMAIVRHGYPLEKITATYMGKTTEATRIPEGVKVLNDLDAIVVQCAPKVVEEVAAPGVAAPTAAELAEPEVIGRQKAEAAEEEAAEEKKK